MSTVPVIPSTASVAYAPGSTPPGQELDRFIDGRPFEHPDGTVTRYVDDLWTISPDPLLTVSFQELPGWLKEPVKRFLAVRWLEEGVSSAALTSTMTRARWWGRALGETAGRDLRDLTVDHGVTIKEILLDLRERARVAVEAAALAKGGKLGQREKRKVLAESGGMLGVEAYASEIDLICEHARTAFGWTKHEINFRVGRIERVSEAARGLMSGDESKVLSAEQRDAMVACCDREIRRYRHALELLEWALGVGRPVQSTRGTDSEEWRGRSKAQREHQANLVFECFFGLNGRAMHSAPALCAALEMSAASASGVGRGIKRRLANSTMDDATAARVLQLRDQIAYRKKDVMGADPARAEMVDLLVAHGLAHDDERGRPAPPVVRGVAGVPPMSFAEAVAASATAGADVDRNAIRAYFGLLDGITRSAVQTSAIYGYASETYGRKRVVRLVEEVVGPRRAARMMALRNALDMLHSNAIKACALKLQLAAARRVSALVALDANPKVDLHWLGGAKTAVVHFRAWKGWGDQGVPDPVPCPDDLADLALVAIEEAQGLTAALRQRASAEDAGRLFLLPVRDSEAEERLGVTTLSDAVLSTWIYNDEDVRRSCLLHRYAARLRDVGGLANFSSHHARHTNATHLVGGGASLASVARYLGHNFNGDPVMAGTTYVAGGAKALRARRVRQIEKLEGTGHIHDAVVRIRLEAAGSDTQRANPGPMELSLEEATRRVREADILVKLRYDADEAAALIKARKVVWDNGLGGCVVPLDGEVGLLADGLTIQVTRDGGCYLPAEDGACPAGGEDCSTGVEADDPSVREGRGCKYRWLVDGERLHEELAVIDAQIATLEGLPQYAQQRAKQIARREIKLAEIASLTRTTTEAR